MLRKILGTTSFVLGATYSIVWYTEQLHKRVEKLAETDTVSRPLHYVAVRAARGDYYNADGPAQAIVDYKFFKTIMKIHE